MVTEVRIKVNLEVDCLGWCTREPVEVLNNVLCLNISNGRRGVDSPKR